MESFDSDSVPNYSRPLPSSSNIDTNSLKTHIFSIISLLEPHSLILYLGERRRRGQISEVQVQGCECRCTDLTISSRTLSRSSTHSSSTSTSKVLPSKNIILYLPAPPEGPAYRTHHPTEGMNLVSKFPGSLVSEGGSKGNP